MIFQNLIICNSKYVERNSPLWSCCDDQKCIFSLVLIGIAITIWSTIIQCAYSLKCLLPATHIEQISAEQLKCEYVCTEHKKSGFLLGWKSSLGKTHSMISLGHRVSICEGQRNSCIHIWMTFLLLGNTVSHPYPDTSVDYKHYLKKKAINKEKGLSPRAQMQIPAFWKQRQ